MRCMASWLGVLAVSLVFPGAAEATRSISACDPKTGECAIAVVTAIYPTNLLVPWGAPGIVIDEQAQGDCEVAREILRAFAGGLGARASLDQGLTVAAHPDLDQIGVVTLSADAGVEVAVHVGSSVAADLAAACSVTGPTFVVNADLQTSAQVCQAMADSFQASDAGMRLSRRLLAALNAGTPVGRDRRGEYSASIRGYSGRWHWYPDFLISIGADVPFSLHWADDLRFELEFWLASWDAPTPEERELIPFTPTMIRQALALLRELGDYRGEVGESWSDAAETALGAWVEREFSLGFSKGTVVKDGTRFIQQPVAVVLLEGKGRGVLIPSGNAPAPESGCAAVPGLESGAALLAAALAWAGRCGMRRRLGRIGLDPRRRGA
jgi:uncharacterized Ntn-hydrolase superfamily protein